MSQDALVRVLSAAYRQKSAAKMDTADAIRLIMAQKGPKIVFSYPKLRKLLWDLAPAEALYRERFAAIYQSGAIRHIQKAVRHPTRHTKHFQLARKRLVEYGLTPEAAWDTVFILYDALGFLTYQGGKK